MPLEAELNVKLFMPFRYVFPRPDAFFFNSFPETDELPSLRINYIGGTGTHTTKGGNNELRISSTIDVAMDKPQTTEQQNERYQIPALDG